MIWKYSQFNMVDKVDDEHYSFYNTSTRQHLILNLEKFPKNKVILSGNNEIDLIPEHLFKKLVEKGFIVEASKNELVEMKKRSEQDKITTDLGLILVILPTLSCNFKCPYCFEDKVITETKRLMNRETQENILKFASLKLAEGIKGPLYVKWFGGEPLLAKDVMLTLTKGLKDIADSHGNKYMSAITTNGYCLDSFSKNEFEILSAQAVQVTLDGPEEFHNKRRPHEKNPDSFSKILENLEYINQFYKNILIRLNVDRSNADKIPVLFDYLKKRGMLNKFKYYLGYIDTEIGKYSLDPQCSSLLSKKDILYIYSTISNGLSRLGIDDSKLWSSYPKASSLACDAQIKNSYVINPDGYVFKCINDATIPERSLFNLNTDEKINIKREKLFLQTSPYEIVECKQCSLLPVCQGGCPAKQIDLDAKRGWCWPFCYIFNNQLIKLAKSKIK